ncbi:Arylsulfatase A [bacterium A37T11]|nr:Arylsulfatase A [bacterium A37T11]
MNSKVNVWLLASVVMSGLFNVTLAQVKSSQPNIIMVLGDDISQEDIGVFGNTHIRTPNIDRLAAEGVRFTNAFVTASSCSPSRTSLLTGRYPHNTGAPELHSELPSHALFFPEELKKAGYYTALAGKWHEGRETTRAYDTLLTEKSANGEGGEQQWIGLLKNRPKNKPFFFWLASYDAHRDWSSSDQFEKPYRPEEVDIPQTLLDGPGSRGDLASYYNEVSRLDDYLGKIRAELERQGIANNTIIVFLADNARPFPGSKVRLYDRGLKTPLIVYWPADVQNKGKTNASLVSTVDLAPTLLDLAGLPQAKSFQGESFKNLLEDPAKGFRKYVFAEHNWHDYEALERSVRTDSFLYILNERPQLNNTGAIDVNQSPAAKELKQAWQQGHITPLQSDVFIQPRPTEELYDVKQDSLQKHNLAADPAYKSQLKSLRAVLGRWRQETGDNTPIKLTPDWYDRDTGKPLPAKGSRGEFPGAANGADTLNRKGPF